MSETTPQRGQKPLTHKRIQELRHSYRQYRRSVDARMVGVLERYERKATDWEELAGIAPEYLMIPRITVKQSKEKLADLRKDHRQLHRWLDKLEAAFDTADRFLLEGDAESAHRAVRYSIEKIKYYDKRLLAKAVPRSPEITFEQVKQFDFEWAAQHRQTLLTKRTRCFQKLGFGTKERVRIPEQATVWTRLVGRSDGEKTWAERLREEELQNLALVDIYETMLFAIDCTLQRIADGDYEAAMFAASLLDEEVWYTSNLRAKATAEVGMRLMDH